MSWAKVDDLLHSHPKAHAAGGMAMGLWVLSLSWCVAHLTDGLVAWHVPASLEFRSRDARRLVDAGLWVPVGPGTHAAHPPVDNPANTPPNTPQKPRGRHADATRTPQRRPTKATTWPWRGKGAGAWTVDSCPLCAHASGLLFRDWSHYQPTKAQVLQERAASAERSARWRERQREHPEDVDTPPDDEDDGSVRHGVRTPTPSRPVLSIRSSAGGETSVTHARATPPPRRCERHAHAPTPGPCRACGDARRAHDEWVARAPVHPPPPCPLHPEHLARACPTCAAEGIPAPVDLREHLRRRNG